MSARPGLGHGALHVQRKSCSRGWASRTLQTTSATCGI